MIEAVNVDDLLEQWEQVKRVSCPRSDSMTEAITHECAKNDVEAYATSIRNCRLNNNLTDEPYYIEKFIDSYNKFTSTFVYRILKSK